jgi:hypothetical protein
MAKNLDDYNKLQLLNIADQLMIPKNETSQAKKSTIIEKITDKAEELSVSVPEPEVLLTIVEPVKNTEEKPAPRRISDHPRVKITLEARDSSVKQQSVSVNEYKALIKIGEPVMVPQPIVDLLESLTDTVHVVNNEGNVEPKFVSRFYVKK